MDGDGGKRGKGGKAEAGARRPGSLVPALLAALVAGAAGLWLLGVLAGSAGRVADDGPPPVPEPGSGEGWEPGRIRVEVLNGSGRPGIAGEATDLLRDAGFDVVYFGNADRFDHETSVVLDRVDNAATARAAGRALGIGQTRVALDPDLHIHASIVLGRDWSAPQPPARVGALDRVRELWRAIVRVRRPEVEPPGEPDAEAEPAEAAGGGHR